MSEPIAITPPRAAVVVLLALVLTTVAVLQRGSAAGLTLTTQALTPYRACTLTATPSTTTFIIDAGARQANPTTNNGTATTIVVASSSGANQRIHIQFDLTKCVPAIPSTATIRLATLRLFVTALPAVCRTLDIFDVTGTAWTEAALTWNNQPFGTTLNNPATGTRTDSMDIGTPAGCENLTANAYVTGWDVTTDVAAFVAGSVTNRGWMIRDDVEGSATARTTTFASKDAAVVIRAPQLVVTWVAVP